MDKKNLKFKIFLACWYILGYVVICMSLFTYEENYYRDKFNDRYVQSYSCDKNPLSCNNLSYFEYYPSEDLEQSFKLYMEDKPKTWRYKLGRWLFFAFPFWLLFIIWYVYKKPIF